MKLLKALAKAIAGTFKRLYDILATYLLFWVLYVAAIAVALHFAEAHLWHVLEVENPALIWGDIASQLGVGVDVAHLGFLLAMHVLIFLVLRRPIAWMQPAFERGFDHAANFFDRITSERWSLRLFGESAFSAIVSALLVPFIVQPTLVRGWDKNAWIERAENLVNGHAVLDLPDSVIAYYRQFGAEAVIADEGVTAEQLKEAFADVPADELEISDAELMSVEPPPEEVTKRPDEVEDSTKWGGAPNRWDDSVQIALPSSNNPVMDRWNEEILDAVDGDQELFSYVKAFMYVESGGRQYAVSRTGCAGLMQFCAGTARSQPYRSVFGRGEVYACGCRGSACAVSRSVQAELESGEPNRVEAQADNFPCEMTDARFDPDKALEAGGLYIRSLHEAFDGNVYFMYIGYNSGPGVARRVFAAVDNNPNATLGDIELHLADSLRPYYGKSADRRAQSLVKVHLPKIQRALQRYGGPSESVMLSGADYSKVFELAMMDVREDKCAEQPFAELSRAL